MVIEFTGRFIVLMGVPIEAAVAIVFADGDKIIHQRLTDTLATARLIEEKILEIADRLFYPSAVMDQAKRKALHLAVHFSHAAEKRGVVREDALPDAVRCLSRNAHTIKCGIFAPQCAPARLVFWICCTNDMGHYSPA